MKKRILFLVDFQNDFVQPDGRLTINNPELIERVQKFADSLQAGMFDEIVVTMDTHFKETYHHTVESEKFPIHCVYNTYGWDLAVNLKDNIPVKTLYKSSNDIWNETFAYKDLQKDWSDKEVYVAGVLSDICVKDAMEGLLKKGAKVLIFDDLTQGLERQTPELVADSRYHTAVEGGLLSNITSQQFFRKILNEKKVEFSRVNQGMYRRAGNE